MVEQGERELLRRTGGGGRSIHGIEDEPVGSGCKERRFLLLVRGGTTKSAKGAKGETSLGKLERGQAQRDTALFATDNKRSEAAVGSPFISRQDPKTQRYPCPASGFLGLGVRLFYERLTTKSGERVLEVSVANIGGAALRLSP